MKLATLGNRVRGALWGGSRGVTLIEALVAIVLVAIIAVAFLGALTTAARSAALADIRTNAESLARSELEYVKSQPFSPATQESPDTWDYQLPHNGCTCVNHPDWWDDDNPPSLDDEYAGYSVKVEALQVPKGDDDYFPTIQQITVSVLHHSSEDTPVFELTGYKTDTKG